MEQSYRGLELVESASEPHLGGSLKPGDPYSYCPSVWDYVIGRFCIASVLDLGSGPGDASCYFFRKGLKVVAVEGLEQSVLTSLYPAIKLDLTKSAVVTKVDLVHCQEVVEHIEEKFIDNVLNSLLCGKIILMTHALPGDATYHHVNLQFSEYWIEKLAAKGCQLAEEDTRRIRLLAERDAADYMSKTGMIFINRARI